ncbi:MAG: asparagine synthase (glutamine-hydrolyzing), partial [Nitrospiraceae bacterium]|nr:asparagine synthase (glutamine-hydrolyzing) [Nitrospiraceae bacterium]
DAFVGLGNVRLKILDLKGGDQPIYNEDNSLVLIYNGEIYNFRQLRHLLKRSHDFSTNTDGEIILHLYEEFGINLLNKLNGMFAFALYDIKKRKLLIARDRFGIKPLFYYYNKANNNFAFASDIKPLLKFIKSNSKDYLSEIQQNINQTAIISTLNLRYNPYNETIIKNIYKLPPGHYLIYNLNKRNRNTLTKNSSTINPLINTNAISIGNHLAVDNNLSIGKYYDISYTNEISDPRQAELLLSKALKESTEDSLISDVPIGIFQSSGVDSQLISLFTKLILLEHQRAIQESNLSRVSLDNLGVGKINTYTLGFTSDETNNTSNLGHSRRFLNSRQQQNNAYKMMNENDSATNLSHILGFNHKNIYLSDNSLNYIQYLSWFLSEPMGDSTVIPTYFLSKEAKKKSKVVLVGDGSDELFYGYEQYHIIKEPQNRIKKSTALNKSSTNSHNPTNSHNQMNSRNPISSDITRNQQSSLKQTSLKQSSLKHSSLQHSLSQHRLTQDSSLQDSQSQHQSSQSKFLTKFISRILSKSKDSFIKKISLYLSSSRYEKYYHLTSIFEEHELKGILNSKYTNDLIRVTNYVNDFVAHSIVSNNKLTPYQIINQFEIKKWLPNDILLKTDSMTMANSIEGRLPYLNNRISSIAFSLTDNLKLYPSNKYLLRRIHNHLAKNQINNINNNSKSKANLRQPQSSQKKRFYLPLDEWYNPFLKTYFNDIINNKKRQKENTFIKMLNLKSLNRLSNYKRAISYRFIMNNKIPKISQKSRAFKIYYPRQIFSIITMAHWFDTFVDRENFEKPLKKTDY